MEEINNESIIKSNQPIANTFDKVVVQAGTNYLGTQQKLPKDMKVGFGTTLAAQFQNENIVGNLVANIKNGTLGISKDANPDYDPTDDIPEDKLNFWENYATASTPQDVDKITRKIDWELENKETIRNAGFGKSLVTGLIAGIADPVNFIPVGGTLYKTGRLGKVGAAALNTATAGLVSSVAQETILNSQQETRTPEEIAMNIAGATILSGILGAGAATLSKVKFKDLGDSFNKSVHTSKTDIQIDPKTQDVFNSTVGAKQYGDLEKLQLEGAYKTHIEKSLQDGKNPLTESQFIAKEQSLVTRAGAGAVIKTFSKTNPILRVFTSKSTQAKTVLQSLATHNMLVGKNLDGIASQQSVETSIKQHRTGIASALDLNRKTYKEYKKRGGTEFKNYDEFNTAVSESMRRGDVSTIPEVERVAKHYRSKVFEPLKERAIEEGLLPADVNVKTAVSYLTRSYNKKKIISQEPVLRERMTNKLRQSVIPDIEKSIQREQTNINSEIANINSQILRLEDPAEKVRQEFLEKAKGQNEGISENELFKTLDTYNEAIKEERKINPKSLMQYIKEQGGIYDEGGDLKGRELQKQLPFIIRKKPNVEINTKQGKVTRDINLDAVALRSQEEGYITGVNGRATINDLLNAIDEELSGVKQYRIQDASNITAKNELRKTMSEIDNSGLDLDAIQKLRDFDEGKIKLTPEQLTKNPLALREIELLKTKKLKLNETFIEEGQKFDAYFGSEAAKDEYVKEIVDNVVHKLKGLERNNVTMPYDLRITNRGPLKERTLNFMDDSELEDFLENNIEKIADNYTRIMGTDVELKKEFGSLDLEEQINLIKKEYSDLAEKATTEKERLSLAKEQKEVVRDIEALRDIMRGYYGMPADPDSLIVRGGRVSRQIQYMSKLGGVAISSIPDIARTVSVHGLSRVFNKGLKNVATNMKGIKLNIKEAKQAGNVLESVLNSRLATLAELSDPYATGSKFERFLTNMANGFSKVNGMVYWNDMMKGFSSVITQQRIIEESQKLLSGKIKKNNRTYLAFLGIDENLAERITKQVDKFGEKEGDLLVANTEEWTDKIALSAYRNALNQDVDRTIISKTAGDVPLFMNTDLGKTIGQFKSFTFAATQQALIAGLQQKDAAALNGLISAISMGSLVYYLKEKGAGREPNMEIGKLIAEGIDRSGMLGIIMEVNNISEKMTGGQVGVNKLIGGEIMSRYASRNIASSLVGPSLGTVQDFSTITRAIATGEISQSDIRAFRNMVPYQNLFYMRWLFDEMEKNLK